LEKKQRLSNSRTSRSH